MNHSFKCPRGTTNPKASLPKNYLDNTFTHLKVTSNYILLLRQTVVKSIMQSFFLIDLFDKDHK